MTEKPPRAVPQGRTARFAAFGQLAGGIAAGMVGEGVRRLARGDRPQLTDLLLTPANALRVTDQLSRLRGAAMKLGQMLSLDAGDLLPPELTQILARLRDNAHIMPPAQLDRVLTQGWGPDWRRRFARFDATPMAAASIGQVHRAVLPDGRVLAVKVQYPGVAASIDADIDNVATLLRMSGVLPQDIDIKPLLSEAKRQLHEEADYLREAGQMRAFAALLEGDARFVLPRPVDELLRPGILPMDMIEAAPIEALEQAPQDVRDAAMTALVDLVLLELFRFGLMQTDPNFANYRWQAGSGRIVLLDFGATRPVPAQTAAAYRRLVGAGLAADRDALCAALAEAGMIGPALMARHRATIDAVNDIVLGQVARAKDTGLFDFADRSLVSDLRAHFQPIAADRASWHIPPVETLFVQRKISGVALLSLRLGVRLPMVRMAQDIMRDGGPS